MSGPGRSTTAWWGPEAGDRGRPEAGGVPLPSSAGVGRHLGLGPGTVTESTKADAYSMTGDSFPKVTLYTHRTRRYWGAGGAPDIKAPL